MTWIQTRMIWPMEGLTSRCKIEKKTECKELICVIYLSERKHCSALFLSDHRWPSTLASRSPKTTHWDWIGGKHATDSELHRQRPGGVRTGRWTWTAYVSLKARRHQRDCDNGQPPTGEGMAAVPTTTWAGCIFLACLSMSQDQTTTYRVTTSTTTIRFSLVVWHLRRFPVRYVWTQQVETVPPSRYKWMFFPFCFLPLLIEEQRWNLD